MSIQVLAVRLQGGDALTDVAELIYRDDDDGKLGYMDRASFAEWVNDNPSIRVYVRDHLGDNQVLATFLHEGARYLRVGEDASSRDPLLRLPRYITATKPVTKTQTQPPPQKGARDPLSALWWFWWLPRGD